jgi:hypothetical protein
MKMNINCRVISWTILNIRRKVMKSEGIMDLLNIEKLVLEWGVLVHACNPRRFVI